MTVNDVNDALVTAIRERYRQILSKIADAAASKGRKAESVRVVVVSKAQPMEVARAAIAAGARILGENYIEEAVEKIAALKETGVEWHMIGHVQSRKAALAAKHFSLLHSLDSVKLARRLDGACAEMKRTLPVLLEFNISGEESKFGMRAWSEKDWSSLLPEIEQILGLAHLHVKGLMTMPPYSPDPEFTRPYFVRLRKLQEFLANRFPQADWSELSMGTSVDYRTAVEEGATYVRVGEAILGPRNQ